MKVYLVGHDFLYEMENLVRLFYPCDRIEMIENATGHEDPGQERRRVSCPHRAKG